MATKKKGVSTSTSSKKVEFFRRRWEMNIDSFKSHKPPSASREIRGSVRIPLMNKGAVGIPELIATDVATMSVDGCTKTVSGYIDIFEGMSLSCFTSDEAKMPLRIPVVTGAEGSRAAKFNGCRIENLVLKKEERKKGEDEVYLHMNVFFPADKDTLCFLYDNQYASVFVEFDATQATFSYQGEKEEKEETEEQKAKREAKEKQGDLPLDSSADPNDNPNKPIPGDTRSVTKSTDKPTLVKRSHHKSK